MPTFRNTLFHLYRRIRVEFYTHPPMKTECSETSAYKIQTLGNYPEESIKHSEHGESLKSGTSLHVWCILCRAGSVWSYNNTVSILSLYVQVVRSLVKYLNDWVQGVDLFCQTRDWV
jgi:hypothetical protein